MKNREKNESKFKEYLPLLTALLFVLGVGGLGFFLYRISPPTAQSTGGANSQDMASHHGGGGTAVANNDTLNALIGKPLPDIQLSDKDGKVYTAADFKGKNTVLFFNEGLMCYPACWNQIAAFGSDARFNSTDIQAISVVVDSSNEWKTAIAKMPQLAKATTMFDTGASASKQLGLLTTASSMHKGSLPGHTYVVIDKAGVVRYVSDDPNMAIANDAIFNKIAELK